jgi:hypothetical protein
MGGFKPSQGSIGGDVTISSADANDTGGGFDGAAKETVTVANINGEIVTTILLDIEGLLVSGTTRDIIGEDGAAASYITQITTAVNGIVYKVEMMCIEVPAGSNTTADIDLAGNSNSLAEDALHTSGGGTSTVIIAAGEAWTIGMRKETAVSTDLSPLIDDYLYIANGSGANSGGTFTAGKFVIKLYGASF